MGTYDIEKSLAILIHIFSTIWEKFWVNVMVIHGERFLNLLLTPHPHIALGRSLLASGGRNWQQLASHLLSTE